MIMENIDFDKTNFIRELIKEQEGQLGPAFRIQTRFPPEPNGYLHIGHAKAICVSFDLAREFSGKCYLRLDDTNPEKESQEFVDNIINDVKWLGYEWDELTYTSDYFDQLHNFAIELIKKGLAYVDHLSAKEIRAYRGTLTDKGKDSPYRARSVDDNLELFKNMKLGKMAEGECILRAKISMDSTNINLRDPAIYRIKYLSHQRTSNQWCIYPMYDFAHSLSDAIEGTTHSLCSLEFQDHRPLYDWFVSNVSIKNRPQQIEFSRLNLLYTMLSKRKLKNLVDQDLVNGWNDPRMPTLSGMRNRGYPAEIIKQFIRKTGVTKKFHTVELSLLESCVRDELNVTAQRRMAVMNPLKVTIENYPESSSEKLVAHNHPQQPDMGIREISLSRSILIDRDDFMEEAPKKFFRLSVGKEVRLRSAYIIHCHKVVKDEKGEVIELKCTYDLNSKSGSDTSGKKIKGTIHWVDATSHVTSDAFLYDRLYREPFPDKLEGESDVINPESLTVIKDIKVENALSSSRDGEIFQFERLGYFIARTHAGRFCFYRTVTLRDTWGKIKGQTSS
jgi:glutaminyl-tRNA synthetase